MVWGPLKSCKIELRSSFHTASVVCSLSEQGENLNLVPIFVQFRDPGKNTQRKSDVLMKWTSLTGKR